MEGIKLDRSKEPDTYAVWSKNKQIRYNSTSGGTFSEFAKVILAEGGVVVGAKYNENNLVEHAIIDDDKDLEKLRQSKYMSSSMGDIYKSIKRKLNEGVLVAFSGSPCQVAGLYSFLGREYDNLFTMDFICRGMNSPKAFKSWLSEIEKQENCRVTRVWFKYKVGGWKSSPKRTRLDFENGTYKVYENDENLYMHGYLTSNLYIRPCCGACQFKGVPRKSDVTFADFWGIEKELDDDKGTSLLLINSDKGRKYFEEVMKNVNFYKKDFKAIFAGNPMFLTSAIVPDKGHDFLVSLDTMTFSEAIRKYTPKSSVIGKIILKGKHVIKRIVRGKVKKE